MPPPMPSCPRQGGRRFRPGRAARRRRACAVRPTLPPALAATSFTVSYDSPFAVCDKAVLVQSLSPLIRQLQVVRGRLLQ